MVCSTSLCPRQTVLRGPIPSPAPTNPMPRLRVAGLLHHTAVLGQTLPLPRFAIDAPPRPCMVSPRSAIALICPAKAIQNTSAAMPQPNLTLHCRYHSFASLRAAFLSHCSTIRGSTLPRLLVAHRCPASALLGRTSLCRRQPTLCFAFALRTPHYLCCANRTTPSHYWTKPHTALPSPNHSQPRLSRAQHDDGVRCRCSAMRNLADTKHRHTKT
jgi:hypothetical protein